MAKEQPEVSAKQLVIDQLTAVGMSEETAEDVLAVVVDLQTTIFAKSAEKKYVTTELMKRRGMYNVLNALGVADEDLKAFVDALPGRPPRAPRKLSGAALKNKQEKEAREAEGAGDDDDANVDVDVDADDFIPEGDGGDVPEPEPTPVRPRRTNKKA